MSALFKFFKASSVAEEDSYLKFIRSHRTNSYWFQLGVFH